MRRGVVQMRRRGTVEVGTMFQVGWGAGGGAEQRGTR